MRRPAVCAALAASLRLAAALRTGVTPDPLPDPIDEHRKNHCAKMHSPPMCKNLKDQGFTSSLVISTFKEDIRWLNEMLWDGNISVYVHNRGTSRSHDSKEKFSDDAALAEFSEMEVQAQNENRRTPVAFETIPNKGDEATAYLSYIIQKYYKLPDVVFFIQGHRCASHAKFDMAAALPTMRLCFPMEKGYLDLNTYDGRKSSEGPHCKDSTEIVKHPIMGYQIKDFKGIWSKLFQEEYGPMPDRLCWDGYAQFAVKKELIQRHPVSFYKDLFKGVMNGTTTMEFFWKMTFLPQAVKTKDHREDEFKAMRLAVLNRDPQRK
mmetsp:Transcript_115166/g.306194  ORF Transcript_115166/g.306194 Transcript_115166/m.306194 type:complete len:321 (-) Transcript_115166:64-1026(-)